MHDDQLHEACGVFRIYAPGRNVAYTTYLGIQALQHRGQARRHCHLRWAST